VLGRGRGHGRVEVRTLRAVTVHRFGFPHAAQALQLTRKTRDLRAPPRRWRTLTVYAITSLPFAQANPARLADLLRGHWTIENGLHYVRDIAFAEDASQLRTGAGPGVMACLRNLAIGVLNFNRAGASTSPPRCATTPATRRGPWPSSASPSGATPHERTLRENAGARAGRPGFSSRWRWSP
jgi:hypothetical protein